METGFDIVGQRAWLKTRAGRASAGVRQCGNQCGTTILNRGLEVPESTHMNETGTRCQFLKQSQSNRCGGISSGQHWAFARELVLRTLRENHRHRHDIGSDIRHRHFSHTAEVPQPAATVPHNWSLLPTHYIYKARYSPPPRHPSLLPAPPLPDPPTPHHPRLPPSTPASRPLLELCSRAHRM